MAYTLEEVRGLEQSWLRRVPVSQAGYYCDWQPAGLPEFTELLGRCLPHVPEGNRTFLEAGCGIGTKCLLAAQRGLAAHGFDRVPEYVAEAERLGASAEVAYAESYGGYSRYGLVYVNHPLVCGPGCDDEAALEHIIHERMASGSVLMSVNYDLAPGCPHHVPSQPCSDACEGASLWPEVARTRDWAAAWVKP